MCIWGGEAQEITVTAGWWSMWSLEKFVLTNCWRNCSSLWRDAEGATISRWQGGDNWCKAQTRTARVHALLYFPRPSHRSAVGASRAGPTVASPSLLGLHSPLPALGLQLAIAPGTLVHVGLGTGTMVESGLRPRQCAWQRSLKVISNMPVLNGKLAAFEWQDTSLLHNPDGEKVKYISHYRKKR